MATINFDNYLLLIDSSPKNGEYCVEYNSLGTKPMGICQAPYIIPGECILVKIIAAHPHIEGCLEFETLPPNMEDDVEKLAMETCPTEETEKYFIKGYKQAKSETMFSLDNMKKAMFEVYKNGLREPKDGKENLMVNKQYNYYHW